MRYPFKKAFLFVLLLLSQAAWLPTLLLGQSYAQQVWDQLQNHYTTITDLGGEYALQNYVMGSIHAGEDDLWTFYFDEGTEYIISAACDNDCTDIDVKILNEDGEVVQEDTKDDDQPLVAFTPKVSAGYEVEVKMYKCSEEPCYFGFGIFRR
ncbi:MAG: hypothetical protein SH809_20150 [Rhodothermales bacterium]|nr:hypothetical protein [Rhodothermales bacterium]